MTFRPGDRIGDWTLVQYIDGGGNGDVWKAEHPAHGVAALKILRTKKRSSERFKRFRREIEALETFADHPGVLPLIAFDLPEDPKQHAWLAMPLAKTLKEALARADVRTVTAGVATVAATMADLAERGIAHRDIKPENLFERGGKSLIGDFGLVDLPDADPITTTAGVRGPRHYVAYEIYSGGPDVDARPGDVFALAKTLWVLASAQAYPLPGPHDPNSALERIETYTPHPFGERLDAILANATRTDSEIRTDMRTFAEELATIDDHMEPGAPKDDDDAGRALTEIFRSTQTEQERRVQYMTRSAEHAGAIHTALSPLIERAQRLQPKTEVNMPMLLTGAWRTLTEEYGAPEVIGGGAYGFHALGPERNDYTLAGGMAWELLADGTLRMLGAYGTFLLGDAGYEEIWHTQGDAPVLSHTCENLRDEISNAVLEHWGDAQRRWSELLAKGRS